MGFRASMWRLTLATMLWLPVAGLGQQATGSGQQAQPAAPAPAGEAAEAPEETQPAQGAAPSTPLTGVEGFTQGSSGQVRNYILPSFQLFEMGDSNFKVGSGPQGFETESSLVGTLALQRGGKKDQLMLDYLGGGTFYTHHSNLDYTMHQLGVTASFHGRHWGLVLDDRGTYLPESPFGYAGFGWGGNLGLGLGGALGSNLSPLTPAFNPAQSLITGRGTQIMNTATAQVSYLASPRSTFTLAGSYGLLHFANRGSVDSRNALFMAGYNRTLTARDTIGLSYGYNTFQFGGVNASFATHFAQLSYGHRITGRVALSAGAGAQLSAFPARLAGSRTTSTSWVANGSLNYSASRNAFALSYSRYTTNGGGVFIGAETQYLFFTWSRQLTRNWSGNLGPAYSRNQNLPQTTARGRLYTYDSAYGTAGLSRALGRYTTMFFGYGLQTQRFQEQSCPTSGCRSSLLRHTVNVGFNWHPRQIMIE